MPPTYDYRTVVLATDLTYQVAMPGNRNRVALIFSCMVAAGQTTTIGWKSGNDGIWYFVQTPYNLTLAYRDYGPLIKEQVTLRTAPVGASVTVTEVTIIPGR